jgi:hypothetical protein
VEVGSEVGERGLLGFMAFVCGGGIFLVLCRVLVSGIAGVGVG